MINHLSIGVRDLSKAARFYSNVLETLGYHCTLANEKEAAYGLGQDQSFFLYPAEGEVVAAPRMHVAFSAEDQEKICAFYRKALDLGAQSVREPAFRPEISASYFGTIIADPDGHCIEVVLTPGMMH